MSAPARLTREQAAILTIYTDVTCGPFADAQAYASHLMGRPIYTHEFADPSVMAELKDRARPDFLALVARGGTRRVPGLGEILAGDV